MARGLGYDDKDDSCEVGSQFSERDLQRRGKLQKQQQRVYVYISIISGEGGVGIANNKAEFSPNDSGKVLLSWFSTVVNRFVPRGKQKPLEACLLLAIVTYSNKV